MYEGTMIIGGIPKCFVCLPLLIHSARWVFADCKSPLGKKYKSRIQRTRLLFYVICECYLTR